MPTIVGDYNMARVQCTIGDFRVTGWGVDDAASVVPTADLVQSEISADGAHVSVSRINDNRHEIELTVRRGGVAFRLLGEKMQAQLAQRDVGAVDPLSFQLFDPDSGDKLVEANAVFMRSPDMPFNKTASEAVFKLLLPNPTITYAANVSTSA